MNTEKSKFERDEFIDCANCRKRINYFKLCKNLDTKWNHGEKRRCQNLVCNECEYCNNCIGKIKRIDSEIKEHERAITELKEKMKIEHGCDYYLIRSKYEDKNITIKL